MKKLLFAAVSLSALVFASCKQEKADPWQDMEKLVQSIKTTSFPEKTFSVLDFGAKANDTTFLNTAAIAAAIDSCSSSGGGVVVIPSGMFFTGPVTLKSNVNLHLEEGAILRFSANDSLYLPVVKTRWEGIDCYNYQPMIYAFGQENIAITGKGTIDGHANPDAWWWWCGSKSGNGKYGYNDSRPGHQSISGRPFLLTAEQNKTPIEERQMGKGWYLRPQLVNLYECDRVLIEGVTLIDSPFWVIHPLMCEDVIVRGVTVINDGPNGDGCDPESCKRVLIEDCYFDTGDDCIAIKSGRNNDGRLWNMPSEDIVVRNCRMKNGHGGVVIGSEISGGFRNLYVENCEMDSPELDRVIRIKTSECRGGLIENIFVRNITVGQCKEAVLKINLLYEQREKCERSFPPTVRNVHLENVTCQSSKWGVKIDGLTDADSAHVYNISVDNSQFNNVSEDGNSISGAQDVRFNNLKINGHLLEM